MYKHGCYFDINHLIWFIIVIALLLQPCKPQAYSAEVEWTTAVRLSDYKGYKSVSLTKYTIPDGTIEVLWDISADTLPKCPQKDVYIYIRHGSYPLVTPYNETYPENFHIEDSHHLKLTTNNVTLPYSIKMPKSGSWFLGGFLPRAQKQYLQAGLNKKNCVYGMGIRVISRYMVDIDEVSTGKLYKFVLPANKSKTMKLTVPEGTTSFSVLVDGCSVNTTNTTSCPVLIAAASGHIPNVSLDTNVNCTSDTCQLDYQSPFIKEWSYIRIVPYLQANDTELNVSLQVNTQNCLMNQYIVGEPVDPVEEDDNQTQIIHYKPKPAPPVTNSSCVQLQQMGRFDIMNEDFLSIFIFPDQFLYPWPNMRLFCPDTQVLLTYFDLSTERDAGGTLKVVFTTSHLYVHPQQDAKVYLCVMKSSIPSLTTVTDCPGGVSLIVNSTSETASTSKVYIPYPSGGRWYLGMKSACYNKNKRGIVNINTDVLSVGGDCKNTDVLSVGGIFNTDVLSVGGIVNINTDVLSVGGIVNINTDVLSVGGIVNINTDVLSVGGIVNINTDVLSVGGIVNINTDVLSVGGIVNINTDVLSDCKHQHRCFVSRRDCKHQHRCFVSRRDCKHQHRCFVSRRDYWRGYGCTDGSMAESDGTILSTMLLLTLSNAFFIPGIFLSIRRRMFVEGLVYVFTMFFSTFYHACDVNNVKYTWCMMDYGVLSFCDFYGSIMSFWVTLLAMSQLNDTVRSIFHMLGALCLAMGVEYNKHGLWVFVAPALTGVVIMSISWVVQCRKRKNCYPSKWRYLKFILPGILLAGTGLIIFAFLETDENYKYTHSAWHVVIALSIVFLLPSRKTSKDGQDYSLVQNHQVEAVGMMSADGIGDDSDDECILQPTRSRQDWNVIL
ncbi:Transmembrane protein 8B,Post-GPI attachment to proteins factor 6 [Mytilus edulis]|uniref:Transmembrane protein 8B,Post-GPI attachment to proteins factor 6 n=1 Tax=Mytilus edulis TaxID=6550 RepID=A0A8S3SCQ5_MYTED|nr:Transmembrane protein 8B,Post-GPI attachment to proteins factor 6 [Mytilus edulis]